MASLRRHPRSPFYFACYTLADGRRTQRSTGTSDKRKALTIALQYEASAREAGAGRFIEARARKVIADIYALANAEAMPNATTRSFFNTWLNRKSLESDERTHNRYSGVAAQFIAHLKQKADSDIKKITPTDVSGFRDGAAQRLAAGTANLMLKILRSAFNAARREGLIDDNPAERVMVLKKKKNSGAERRPFTLEELRKILKAANQEWSGMILFGFYTGQRLGDIALITRKKIDLNQEELNIMAGKTGRRQILPLPPPLLKYVRGLKLANNPETPLFPRAYEIVQKQGRTGNLSNQFHRILVAAGLADKRSHHKTGKGRNASRKKNEISFHCLRHTATTLLKAAGVSDAVAREFVGHDSAAVSQNYTHIPADTLRQAASKLPNILK